MERPEERFHTPLECSWSGPGGRSQCGQIQLEPAGTVGDSPGAWHPHQTQIHWRTGSWRVFEPLLHQNTDLLCISCRTRRWHWQLDAQLGTLECFSNGSAPLGIFRQMSQSPAAGDQAGHLRLAGSASATDGKVVEQTHQGGFQKGGEPLRYGLA